MLTPDQKRKLTDFFCFKNNVSQVTPATSNTGLVENASVTRKNLTISHPISQQQCGSTFNRSSQAPFEQDDSGMEMEQLRGGPHQACSQQQCGKDFNYTSQAPFKKEKADDGMEMTQKKRPLYNLDRFPSYPPEEKVEEAIYNEPLIDLSYASPATLLATLQRVMNPKILPPAMPTRSAPSVPSTDHQMKNSESSQTTVLVEPGPAGENECGENTGAIPKKKKGRE